ncbi:GEVED domain-containing protein [Winogradskyella damuponensis]|uniref:T9SS type A sorting domain-containing protein n=1 Tax=Winogradskyella damuponensis TaxID=943939 RepID=A0ABP8CMW4_9FLAO
MKKITLCLFALCCFAFSWQGQSQIFIDESLDSGVPADWTNTYYYSNTNVDYLCEGTGNVYNNLYYSTWTEEAFDGDLTSPNYVGVSNETDTTVEFQWNARPYSTNAVDYIIHVEYSTNDGTDWNLISSFAVTETTACTQYSDVIPAASLPSGSDFKFRVRGEWVSGDSYFYIDNIYITQAISCPQPSDLSVSNLESNQAVLSWVENGSASLYNVEVVLAGDAPTGIATDTGVANSFTKTGLAADTAYEFYVQADCTGGDVSAWVGPGYFYTGYCVPESTNPGTYTDSFTVTGALMDTSTSETGYTGTGYADYYDTNTIESFEGGAFDFSATIVGGTAGYAVWVDWNNDFIFDADTETVYNTTGYDNGPFEATIAVPSGTAMGDYRLRTMVDYNDSNPNDDACAFGSGRGEVEDYKLTIVAAPTDAMDFNNVQWVTDGVNGSDVSLSISAGTAVTVYAKGYEAGVTDAEGAGAGVECWIAINNENTDPATWDNALWKVATYSSDSGNDDEYAYTTSDTPPGTNYVAARWRLNNAAYTYGGFNGTWDGTNNVSIELVVDPVANDDCAGAIALTVNADFDCAVTTTGTIQYATASGEDEATCFGTENDDVWFSFVATAESHKIDLLNVTGDPTDLYHSVWSGACGTLTNINCSDSDNSTLTGLTVGETYLLRVNSYSTAANPTTTFDICIGTPPPPPANDDCEGAVVLTVENEITDLASATQVSGTIASATDSGIAACAGSNANDDVWYSFVATSTAANIDVTDDFDGVIELFSGACGSLVSIECDDYDSTYGNPRISRTDFVVGETYFVRVFYYSVGPTSTPNFTIALWSPDEALSVNNFETEAAFSYFPNPVKNTLTLNAKNTIEQVAMYNMLGQEVLRVSPNSVDSNLDMSSLQTGTYFVKVTIANVTETIRVMKQ